MKKLLSIFLSFSLVLLLLPYAYKVHASTDDSAVIDMHGAKTWMGSPSDWSKKWDEDNFENVTGDNVSWKGDLTVKAGNVGDINVSGNDSKLVMKGGTAKSIYCAGKIEVQKGTVKSVESESDIKISGGSIHDDVVSNNGDITLENGTEIKGGVKGNDIDLSSGATIKVLGTITGEGRIYLNKCNLSAKGFDGDGNGILEIDKYDTVLPPIENMKNIIADSDSDVLINGKITAESLYIQDDAEFATNSTLEVDTLQGPGTLYFNAGKLTVHYEILDKPLLIFADRVHSGMTAFKADEDTVSTDDVKLYDYTLEKETSGGYDQFKLRNGITDGIAFDKSGLSIESGKSATITATVKPLLKKFAEGTKIKWEIHGDNSAFSISPNSENNTCTVTSSGSSGMHKATVTAYLIDKNGDRLIDYKSDSCIVNTGYEDNNEINSNTNTGDLTLDTSTVSILPGNKYCVLATTNDSAMPHAMSYNSSVATVGTGKPVKDKNGNSAWIYPVTGISSGKVTIDIAGQKMLVKVSPGIIVDTASYTMAPGGKYCIGVQVKGINQNKLSVYTTDTCCGVSLVKKQGNGKCIYRVTADHAGNGYVVFYIDGGGVISTKISVKNGAKASGKSARLVALA